MKLFVKLYFIFKSCKSSLLTKGLRTKKISKKFNSNKKDKYFDYFINKIDYRAKFTPEISGCNFGSICFVRILDKPIYSIGCRSPPVLIFALKQKSKFGGNHMFNDKSPYTLRTEIIDDERHYFVSFVDGENRFCETEVPHSIFIEIHNSKKIIRNLTRSDERHVEITEVTEETLYSKALNYQKGVEDVVIDLELSNELKSAISELPEVQRRRFILHYEYKLTFDQIAALEGCTKMPVKRSIDRAREKILEKLKKLKI